jgi:hypothetical protein
MKFTSLPLIVAAAVLPFASIAVAAAGPGKVTPSPWTQTNGNAANSRSNPTESTLTTKSILKLRYLRSWTAPAAPPARATGVCLGGQTAVALVGDSAYGVINGYFVRVDASTGRTKWTHYFRGGRTGDPSQAKALAVSHHLVIVGSQDCGSASDPNGYVEAYSAKTGKRVWSSFANPACTAGACNANGGFSTLLVSGKYVVSEGNSAAPGGVTVANVANGKVIWQDDTNDCQYGEPIVVDRLVVYSTCDGSAQPELLARHLSSGDVAWHLDGAWTAEAGDSDAKGAAHLLVITPDGKLRDLHPASGTTNHYLPNAGTSVLAVDAKRVYVRCGEPDGNGNLDEVCAYRLRTGNPAWGPTGIAFGETAAAQPLLSEAGGVLYTNDGIVLNAASGGYVRDYLSPQNVNRTAEVAVAIGNGRLATINSDDRVLDFFGLKGE